MYDVIIIGAGVAGGFVARELSKYNLKTCILEKEADVAMGSSKANSAIIHAGFDAKPGSLKSKLNVLGNKLIEDIVNDLHVPFKRIGSFVLAFKEEEIDELIKLKEKGEEAGVEGLQIISGDEARLMEPNLSKNVVSVLFAQTAGIVCPYELTVATIENAVDNGAELKLETEVLGIKYEDELFEISTSKGIFTSKYIVNASGVYADGIAKMIGDDSFKIKARRGEYLLFDKSQGSLINKVIFQLPTEKGKGILVTPTVDGNLLIGPNAEEVLDKDDISTSKEGTEYVLEGAKKAVTGFNMRELITSFAGLRAGGSTGDFIIGPSSVNPKFINLAGFESPGLSSAPAVGKYILDILKSQGLQSEKNPNYQAKRRPVMQFRDLSENELDKLIRENPLYGKMVCRCEKVTEGEIVDSIKRSVGATNLDAVKRRTRAGMGRCQGGFCSPRVVEILARELKIEPNEVTKMGGNSWVLVGKVK